MSDIQEQFLRDLVDQQRAGDTYGQLDRLGDDYLLKPFVVDRETARGIAVDCDVDLATQARLRSFYQAVAVGIERSTGVFTTTVLDLNHEGFGRSIIFAGRLVVVSIVLRDAQRFGFTTTEKLAKQGQKLVDSGADVVKKHLEVARDES